MKKSLRADGAAEAAQILALKALGWIAADDERLARFLAETGAEAGGLRAAAADPAFQAGALDWVLGDESALMAFCAEAGLKPEEPLRARRFLPGAAPDW